MVSHNDIILSLSNEILAKLLSRFYGQRGAWSNMHFVCDKKVEQWTFNEVQMITKPHPDMEYGKNTLSVIQDEYNKHRRQVIDLSLVNSFKIIKTFEFPLIKGQGQYKVTKGFLDLVVHISPIKVGKFCAWQKDFTREYVIEVKRKEDLSDFGNVLRQIKEYKEYYVAVDKRFDSDLLRHDGWDYQKLENTDFVLLCDSIPSAVKELFESEGILCIEYNPEIKIDTNYDKLTPQIHGVSA